MTRYKLKELKNTKLHETTIQQTVHKRINQKKPKKIILIPLFTVITSIALLFLVINLIEPELKTSYSNETPSLLNIFYEIDGHGVAYSENFKEMDMQQFRKLRYYKEVLLTDFLQANNISFPEIPAPFNQEDGTVIAVNDGYFTELQFHFKSGEHFLNLSLAPSYVDPINEEMLQENLVDAAGNPIELERLTDSITLVKQKIHNGGGLVFKHYYYDEETDSIKVVATMANEYYSYADELIYHFGYNYTAPVDELQMTNFVKEFILNNEIQTLNLEQVTIEDNWLNRGGKTTLICFVISIISFVLMYYLLRNASAKTTKIAWSVVWIFIHTPILTWLISFNTGVLYQDGFAGIGMLILSFPILFILGLCIILPRNRTFFIQLVVIHILVYSFAVGSSIYDQLRPESYFF